MDAQEIWEKEELAALESLDSDGKATDELVLRVALFLEEALEKYVKSKNGGVPLDDEHFQNVKKLAMEGKDLLKIVKKLKLQQEELNIPTKPRSKSIEKTLEDLYKEDLELMKEAKRLYGNKKAYSDTEYVSQPEPIERKSHEVMKNRVYTGPYATDWRQNTKLGGHKFAKRVFMNYRSSKSSQFEINQTLKINKILRPLKIGYWKPLTAEYMDFYHPKLLNYLQTLKGDGKKNFTVLSLSRYVFVILNFIYETREKTAISREMNQELMDLLDLKEFKNLKIKYELIRSEIIIDRKWENKEEFRSQSTLLKAREKIFEKSIKMPKNLTMEDFVQSLNLIETKYDFKINGGKYATETLTVLTFLEMLQAYPLPKFKQFVAWALDIDQNDEIKDKTYKKIYRLAAKSPKLKRFLQRVTFSSTSLENFEKNWSY